MQLKFLCPQVRVARASAQLKRRDLAGKTGTTNDYYDAWFCGYQATVAGCAWMGYDQPKKLGSRETGGVAALPIWIAYMQTALRGVPAGSGARADADVRRRLPAVAQP